MNFTNILSLLCGVAFFLFGMSTMGDGLKKVAGSKLENYLWKLSSTPLKGFALGAAVTAVIQSSAATSVMTVSFINAGMIKLSQAVCIILGANVGTSVTGWLLTLSGSGSAAASIFSTATLVALLAIFGVLMRSFMKKNTTKNVGMILVGLAILLTAMSMISESVDPLKESEQFRNVLVMFSNPILGVLAGIVVAAVVQSASAGIGILQALSVTGAIPYSACLPLLLGINIGAAAPVMIAMVGSSKNGKRAALTYLLAGVLGLFIIYLIYLPVNLLFDLPFMAAMSNKVGIAIMNSAIRILIAFVLLPCHKLMEKLLFLLVKPDEDENEDMEEIDSLVDGLLEFTPIAIEKATIAVDKMTELSCKNVRRAIKLLTAFDKAQFAKVQDKEALADKYEDKISTFVVKIGKHSLNSKQQIAVSQLLSAVGDLERLSDHALNVAESALEIYEKKIVFSEQAQNELELLTTAVLEVLDMAQTALINRSAENCDRIEALEEVIDEMCKVMRQAHISRVRSSDCTIETGFVFNDLLANLERISDHCSNLGYCVIHGTKTEVGEHEFSDSVINGAAFKTAFNNYRSVYLKTLK
ncbi:MAG: Na/Pi cotransporter family protein [Clostridia bacterium]|nr:Na/Pi cotransporter family protein [Clostridia bacterium]